MDFKTSDKEYTLSTLVEKASRKVVRQTVGDYLNGYIDRLLAVNRVGNAKTFQELRTSLTRFCHSLDFYFLDIDTEWLKRYEQWLRVERHYSDNSIGIRFRSLRVLYNSAITDGLIKKTDYPFDTFKVSRFKEATAKRSPSKEDIRRIMDCKVRTLTEYPKPFLQLAKDLFLFSYLSCGINLTDMLHIRYADIVDGRLVFNRQKTGNLLDLPTPLTLSCSRHTRMSGARSRNILLSVIRKSMGYGPEMPPRIYLATLDTELCQSFGYRCIIVIKVYEKTGTTLHGRFELQHLCFGSKKTIAGATVIVDGAHVGTGMSVDAKP